MTVKATDSKGFFRGVFELDVSDVCSVYDFVEFLKENWGCDFDVYE